MKQNNYILILLCAILFSVECRAQFDVSSNCFCEPTIQQSPDQAMIESIAARTQQTGIPCNANTFYSLTINGTVDELEVNGNVVTNNGPVVTTSTRYSLAYCNNVDGGAFSPTFYSHQGSTYPLDYYNGTGWTTTSSPLVDFPGGIAGYGNYLYLMYADSILRYDGSAFIKIYEAPANQTFVIADAAVDDQGNIWSVMGYAFPTSTNIVTISPNGVIIHQYPFAKNCTYAYGAFLLNGKFYIGFGNTNPNYPDQLLPISIVGNAAVLGTPIPFSSTTYIRDFASCNPGSPVSVEEYEAENLLPVFPNPSTGILNLPSKFSGISFCKIFSSDGNLISENAEVSNGRLNVEAFPSGIYFLEVKSAAAVYHARFVKE
jgi:hypothetical protein